MTDYDAPIDFVPTMKDETLPHQIGFKHTVGMNGSGVKVMCNCGWVSDRTINVEDSMDALNMYRSHL